MSKELSIEVDILSESVVEVLTGKVYQTIAAKVGFEFINTIHKKHGWNFNWKSEFRKSNCEIFKLTLRIDETVLLGLISLEVREDHVHVHLVESSPNNIGKRKKFLGIGANLFAIACKLSDDMGFDGVIVFHAKTKLIEHYSVTLGALHLVNSRMILLEKNARILIQKYFSDEKH